MPTTLSDLTTRQASVEYQTSRTRWFRQHTTTHRTTFLDWVIDGVRLRELVPWNDIDLSEGATTMRNPSVDEEFARHVLRVLAGEPAHDRCEARTDDGRVPLMVCHVCFDIYCPTLSAELHVHEDTVEWRHVGWQFGYDVFDSAEQGHAMRSFHFDRARYEGLIAEQLRSVETS